MEELVAPPKLQSKAPVAVVDKTEFPQASTSVTTGAEGMFRCKAVPEPMGLVHELTVVVTVYVPSDTEIEEVVAPVLQDNDPAEEVDNTD